MYFGIGLIVVVLLVLFFTLRSKEHITEQSYALTSRGLNLMNTGNSYLGGLAVLNAAENAASVADIVPSY